MLPELIVGRAQELGLGLIAITDHNSAENAAAVVNAAQGTDIIVWPGMELQTREEVHLLCLFDTLEQAAHWQEEVYAHLPDLKNKEDVFGAQVVLDTAGEPIGYNDRLLLTSTSFSLEEAVRAVGALNGVSILAHVDRPAYSVIANLGFIPPGLEIAGVEISPLVGPEEARARFPQLAHYGLVASGDAHRLQEISRRTTLKMEAPTVAELALALAGEGDRGVWVDGMRAVVQEVD